MYLVKNEVNVRFGECDPMGIAHHSHYFHWFELGRFQMLDMTGINQYLKQEKLYFPIIDIRCTYKKSARFQDDLIVETYLKSESKVYIEFVYKLFRKRCRVLLAEGFSKHVLTRSNDQLISRLPEEILEKLQFENSGGVI